MTEYNESYNYFAGMNESDVLYFQKAATTGHRPTWSMGVHGSDSNAWETLRQARDAGVRIVIVNAQPTAMDDLADAVLRGAIGELLPAICAD